ncbi:MAG: cysteine hydrolase [Turicibacter sp.]|nr:cysteine hydrolase [Turicibacter sp.]
MTYDLASLLKSSEASLTQIIERLHAAPSVSLETFSPADTAIIIVDMVNGFIKEGPMSSPRIQTIIPTISQLMIQAKEIGLPMVAFADSHLESSIEFESYPPHCLMGTSESEIVDELKAIGGYDLILKGSTNGFLEPKFHHWLTNHPTITQFIVVGDCTDICVEQFVITLKTYFTVLNKKSRILVPMNSVETYDLEAHVGDFMNVIALYKMQMNGIEIIKEITN